MKRADSVFRELEQLYDFHKELRKFRLPRKQEPSKPLPKEGHPAPEIPPRNR